MLANRVGQVLVKIEGTNEFTGGNDDLPKTWQSDGATATSLRVLGGRQVDRTLDVDQRGVEK